MEIPTFHACPFVADWRVTSFPALDRLRPERFDTPAILKRLALARRSQAELKS